MSPEQARGEAATARPTSGRFGVVFYELLTGISPFGRPSTAETLAGRARHATDYSVLPPKTPESARHVVAGVWKRSGSAAAAHGRRADRDRRGTRGPDGRSGARRDGTERPRLDGLRRAAGRSRWPCSAASPGCGRHRPRLRRMPPWSSAIPLWTADLPFGSVTWRFSRRSRVAYASQIGSRFRDWPEGRRSASRSGPPNPFFPTANGWAFFEQGLD